MNRFASRHPEDWEAREEAMVSRVEAEADRLRKDGLSGATDRPRPVSGEGGGGVDRAPVSSPAEPVPKSFSQILAGLFKQRMED